MFTDNLDVTGWPADGPYPSRWSPEVEEIERERRANWCVTHSTTKTVCGCSRLAALREGRADG